MNPYVALFASVTPIGSAVLLNVFRLRVNRQRKSSHQQRIVQRLWWALRVVPWFILELLLHNTHNAVTYSSLMLPLGVLIVFFCIGPGIAEALSVV